jgi:hypothetical protein
VSLDVRRVTVPLSDEEARILREIEQQLYESDPDLARHVSTTTVYSEPVNRLRIASVALVGALALTIYLLSVHFLAAFGGFLVCFALGVIIEGCLRSIGKAGVNERSALRPGHRRTRASRPFGDAGSGNGNEDGLGGA